jgi:hypothetical protein
MEKAPPFGKRWYDENSKAHHAESTKQYKADICGPRSWLFDVKF